ncbi:hypothetical protein FDO65_10110 [Nakamurella flava]|uniref:IPT/TIG domain-containing protein n=1 Tax=Nakamurella flava TaxID=2576308 RepID=A0A4U6QNU0_9ACTN|nr:IPT/TIG domain-containing protein [Nakamurella flava]TKV61868.1 hypothetical protein FDO65_10110 [Nakamurella flava]
MTAPVLAPTSAGVLQLASAKRLRVNLAYDPSLASQVTPVWADAFGITNLTPGAPSWDKIDATAYHNADVNTGLVNKRDKKVASSREISGVWQREIFADPADNAATKRLKDSAEQNKLAQVMIFNAVDRTEQATVYIVDVTWDEQGGAAADKGVDNFTLSVQGAGVKVANPMGAAIVPDATSVNVASAAAGVRVIITGTGFAGATSVKFGSTESELFKVIGDTEIRAVVTGSTGSKPITVATPQGPDTTPLAFTIV